MKGRRLIFLAVLLVLTVIGFAAISYFLSNSGSRDALVLSGNIEAHESLLSFQVAGRIADLPIEEGKWLEQDAIVARLDDTDYRQQVANDQAALEVAQAQLNLALAGPRPEEREADRQAMLNFKADLAQRRLDYNRVERLYREHVATEDQRDQAATALERSEAGYRQARQVYLEARNGTRKEDIDIARANLDHAREVLKLAQIQLDHTLLRTPFAGVVMVRQVELGEVVTPGTPIITLGNLDHVWMRAYVAETDIARIRFDQPATIRTDSFPGKSYRGRVSFISSKAEFTPKSVETHQQRVTLVYRIKIEVDNPGHELKPGMPTDVEILLAPLKSND